MSEIYMESAYMDMGNKKGGKDGGGHEIRDRQYALAGTRSVPFCEQESYLF